jgi:hypothetical protein
MASFVYDVAKEAFLKGDVNADLETDMRILLVMGTTTFDTERTITTVGGLVGTTGYFDGTNHGTTNGIQVATETVSTTSNITKLDFTTDTVISSLGAGTADVVGFVLISWNTTRDGSMPILWVDCTDFNGNGGDVTIQWPATGVLTLTDN